VKLTLAAVTGAALTLLGAIPIVTAQSEPISVDQEPRHRIVFADERLRVLEVVVAAGDTTLEHRHDLDLVTINIENGPTRTRDRGADWGAVRPREVGSVNAYDYSGKPLAHVVQSVGDRAYRLTGVENRKQGGWSEMPAIAAPDLEVAAESRAFRAYRLRLAPGARASHVHPVPVVVTLVGGSATLPSDGDRGLSTPGQWAVVGAGARHALTAGATGAQIVEVEVR
jgi:quercetin dioxygenase-like cupin family protein